MKTASDPNGSLQFFYTPAADQNDAKIVNSAIYLIALTYIFLESERAIVDRSHAKSLPGTTHHMP
jgi:hypothetical protein